MRAISTVLDVSLCLLLVSASALTLAGTPMSETRNESGAGPATAPDAADEAATVLATSTASVTYRAPSSDAAAAGVGDPENRTVHDTLAGLLAGAVAAKAGPDPATDFARAVAARVGRALHRSGGRAQVVARRTTARTSGRSVGSGRVVAGPAPPPDADVYAAAFSVRGVRLTVRTWSR
ncbi:hypothetical protein M0R89_12245 [Halorussus limi]|uniref:Uncharacterized protein n=1 Tax=Halorussus limi TaxID=2938695 RepID=A0A8U0HRL4_9EURY|nr:hypothetical protein [Halorussus limi]UPV73314.1 hypothetical protein M0R89_12245 [Halorussus limi]